MERAKSTKRAPLHDDPTTETPLKTPPWLHILLTDFLIGIDCDMQQCNLPIKQMEGHMEDNLLESKLVFGLK